MKIVFNGTVLVSTAAAEKISYLVLECDKGSGIVGELALDKDRCEGAIIDLDKLAAKDDVVVMEFSSPASIAVVQERLQQCLMHLLDMPFA